MLCVMCAKRIYNVEEVGKAFDRLYASIVDQLPEDARLAVIGVRTRGETLAARLVDRLRSEGKAVEHGVLDITFYRDDISRRNAAPLVRATEIDFNIDDAYVLLVDDVLQTGRSVRAALDALHDFGRPKVIRLAVLIDRGGRELPIRADFVGKQVDAPDNQRVQLRLKENDGEEGVFIIPSE